MNQASDGEPTVPPTDRVSALRASGELSGEQATAIHDAIATSETATASTPTAAADAGSLYLQGQIERAELERRGRRAAVAMGAMYGLLMALIWTVGKPGDWALNLAIWGVAGVAFGWAMHRFMIRKVVEKHIALREAAGGAGLQPIAAADVGQCPQCRAESLTDIGPRSPTMLHWQLNPGLAVNELLLGQRLPAHMHRCDECGTHSVSCHACMRAIHSGYWSGKNAFFHWGSLHCPHCDAALPTLSNWTAAIVRAPFTLVGWLIRKPGGEN